MEKQSQNVETKRTTLGQTVKMLDGLVANVICQRVGHTEARSAVLRSHAAASLFIEGVTA